MLGFKTHFLLKLSIHGLNRRFAIFDTTLRKLPGMFSNSFTPKDLILLVYEDNTNIRTVAFAIKHAATPIFKYNCL